MTGAGVTFIEPPSGPSSAAPNGRHGDGQNGATVTAIGPVTTPVRKAPRTAPAKRQPGATTTAIRVAKAAAKMPDASVAAIAKKAGVSESTARRHMPATEPPA